MASAKQIAKELEAFLDKVVTKIALDVTANLQETTPVDTGWARANWVPQIGTPYAGEDLGRQPTVQDATSHAGTQQSAIASVAATYSIPKGKIFITNNVKYIEELNATVAPAFVQKSIVKAITQDIKNLK